MSQLQQPAKLPTGLAALVALQRTASATTPDGAPTVAAQMAQKAKAQMQGQGQAPQGIEQEAPPTEGQGVQDAAQQAGIAGQIGQQQQQQAQQAMAQMAQAQTPKPEGPLQLAQGGIAALPADNMHNMGRYARGGVIGFDGETSSKVPELSEAEKRAKEITLLTEGTESTGSSGTLTAEQQAALANIAKITRERTLNTNKATTPYNPVTKQLGESLIERGGVDKPRGLEQFTPEQRNELARKLLTGAKQTADVKDAETAEAKLRSGINAPARQQAQPAPPTLERPNADATYTAMKDLIGDVDTKKSDRLQTEREALTGERTGMLDEKIAAMKAGTASRQALEKERQGNLQGQKLRAWLTGMSENYRGRGGEEVGKVTAEDFKIRQTMAQADAADALAITEERKANLAARIGDKDQQAAAEQAAQAAKMKSKELTITAFTSRMTSLTQQYSSEVAAAASKYASNAGLTEARIRAGVQEQTNKLQYHDVILRDSLAQGAAKLAGNKTPTVEQILAAGDQVLKLNPQYRAAELADKTRQATAKTAAYDKIAKATKDFNLMELSKLKDSSGKTMTVMSPEYPEMLHKYLSNTEREASELVGQVPQGGAAAPAAPAVPQFREFSDFGRKV